MKNNDPRLSAWIKVQAYKHDGSLHRQWSPAFLVEETDEYWCLASKASLVTESDGRKWMTREQAIFLLFKHRWMNVIAMFKEKRGICYYVNIASPTLLDDGYLKYIDYDLDVKLFPNGDERVLDENEYARHAKSYGYPEDLSRVIEQAAKNVKAMMDRHEFPFQDEAIERFYQEFLARNPVLPGKGKQHESKKTF